MERLLIDAIEIASTRGGEPVRLIQVAAVVEDLQAQYVPHWRRVTLMAAGRTRAPATLSARAFRSLTALEPAYRWGLRRGWTWLPAVRRRLRGPVRRLLRLDR
jgi:hypothetical protein